MRGGKIEPLVRDDIPNLPPGVTQITVYRKDWQVQLNTKKDWQDVVEYCNKRHSEPN